MIALYFLFLLQLKDCSSAAKVRHLVVKIMSLSYSLVKLCPNSGFSGFLSLDYCNSYYPILRADIDELQVF